MSLYSLSMTFLCVKLNKSLKEVQTKQGTNDVENIAIDGSDITTGSAIITQGDGSEIITDCF